MPTTDIEQNKQMIRNFVQVVWCDRNLAALSDFWTEDCLNHTTPEPANRGLDALRVYHETFFADFSAFSNVEIKIIQQIAEKDRVVTHITT